MANETNTRVSLREYMDQKFEAQEKFNAARFDSLEEKIDERWSAHKETHRRERGAIAGLITIGTVIASYLGIRLPK